MPSHPIVAAGLTKRYAGRAVVDGLDLVVERGTIFGVVGPNGAGKTTTVECIEGLRRPDAGSVRVFGLDPASHRSRVFRRLGVQLQDNSLYDTIRAGEALRLFASFHPDPLPPDRLLAEVGLEDCAGTAYARLSGGQRRKLLTALALVGNPEAVILDEPTSGLDPQSRRDLWVALRRHRARGLTLLLTTHDLHEAEEQCDLVAVLDRGRVVARGAPAELLDRHRLRTRISLPANGVVDAAFLRRHPAVRRVETVGDRLLVYGDGGDRLVPELTARLGDAAGGLVQRPAGLEDLYFLLTGVGEPPAERRP